MPYEILRWFLPAYLLAYFLLVIVWRVGSVWKRTGKNPVILGDAETAHDYVGRVGKYLSLLIAIAVGVYSASPAAYERLLPVESPLLVQELGLVFLLISLAVTVVAQIQMGLSWRVGIETSERTAIVNRGLYRCSRNPIYVGLYLANLGLLLVTPNVLTLLIFVLGHFTLQILVRLEEGHLQKIQGAPYADYCARVRRWL